MGQYSTKVNMAFGTELVFKKDYRCSEFLTFEKGTKVKVANYVHKYYVEIYHPRITDLPKIKVEQIDDLLEEVKPIINNGSLQERREIMKERIGVMVGNNVGMRILAEAVVDKCYEEFETMGNSNV
jgi:hypothetical protein